MKKKNNKTIVIVNKETFEKIVIKINKKRKIQNI